MKHQHQRSRRVAQATIEVLEQRALFATTLMAAAVPTTQQAVTVAAVDVTAAPTFSQPRGFYTSAFDLTLSSATDGASIRYTLDGSDPTSTTGTLYIAPIHITTTAVVRALAYKSGNDSAGSVTNTYLFLNDVLHQPKNPAGYATPTLAVGTSDSAPLDYEMDPAIVNDPAYAARVLNGLKSIPSMMISVNRDEIFGNGFYDTDDVEVPMSMEYIDPAHPQDNTQLNGGIENHAHTLLKTSLRISFKKIYGAGHLDSAMFQHAPVGGDSATGKIDQIVLRAGHNRAWTTSAGQQSVFKTTFTEDEWARQNQVAINGEGVHGSFVNLYINGLYFGLYNTAERPDEHFGEAYYGGSSDNWFAISHDGVKNGDAGRWNYLVNTITQKDQSDPANYAEMTKYLDVKNFADYLIGQFYAGVSDWPGNNWWAGGDTATNMPFKFFTWDAEYQMNTALDQTPPNGAWVHPAFRQGSTASSTQPIVKLWRALVRSPDFKATFADRAQRAVSGPLADSAALARLDTLNNFIKDAVVDESARWGDALKTLGKVKRTPAANWDPAVDAMRKLVIGNAARLISALRDQDLFPNASAVTFSKNGGTVDAGFKLTLTNPNGSGAIYYTTDGTDPRLPGGGLNPSALLYDAAAKITISGSVTINARVKTSAEWSALGSAGFSVASIKALRVSEMMYHPVAPAGSAVDKDNFEFIEFRNTANTALNLNGVTISGGIDYVFGNVTVPAGGYVVVAKNLDAFKTLYGDGITPVGVYSGKLDNGGETITVTALGGLVLDNYLYDDAWYPDTDGLGLAMKAVHPTANNSADLNTAAGWTAGTPSPGRGDEVVTNLTPVVSAGSDQSGTVGGPVVLNGTASDDGLPTSNALTTAWTVVSGPGDVIFADATLPSTTATFSAVGIYTLRLTASDGELSGSDDVIITISEVPPPPGDQSEFEGEDGTLAGGTLVAADNLGYTGTGYADFGGNGSGLGWALDRAAADYVTLGFRYANGSTGRPLTLTVNGVSFGNLPFATTGGWTNWQIATVVVPLKAGTNAISLTAGPVGGPNIDRMTITPGATPPPVSTAVLSGFVFNDVNKNGLFDTGDTKTASQTVFLDLDADGVLDINEVKTTTATDGTWSFTGLAAGMYHVRRVFAAGTTISTPPIDITLAAAQVSTGLSIGAKSTATPPPAATANLSGNVFNDNNKNAKYDAGDGIGKGVVVFLDTDNDGVLDTTEKRVTTDANGKFIFTGLAAGTYRVRRVFAAGQTYSTPLANITLTAGQVKTGVLIGTKKA